MAFLTISSTSALLSHDSANSPSVCLLVSHGVPDPDVGRDRAAEVAGQQDRAQHRGARNQVHHQARQQHGALPSSATSGCGGLAIASGWNFRASASCAGVNSVLPATAVHDETA
jgi:hypothetical protein